MKAITLTIFFNRRFRHSPFLFILLLCSSSAFSASISWDGGGGTDKDWSNPLNWSGDVVPGSTDQVTITGVYTPTITSNVGTINQLILNTSSTGSPRLVISTLGSLGVTNLTTTNQNQVTLQGGAIENSGTLTITTGGNTTNNTSKGLVFINGSGAFISAASYSGSGTLTINTSAASNIGSCINFSQTNANPVLTVGGTLNFVAASNQYVIVATNGTNALINGTGTISAGTSGSTVTFGLINVNSSNIASTLTVDSGVILNSYSTGFSNSSGSIVLGSTIGNTFINKGVLNIGGSGGNGIYCAPTAITNNLSNEGTINLSGAFSYSIIRFGGTGTSNFTNSGTINIDNIPSTSTGIGMSAAPTVNINNTGSLVFGASGTNSAAITLGDSKVVFNNTGTVTINKGYLIGTSGTGKASFNNNTNGVFRSNVGNSNTGISTNITFTNSGGTFEGSCAITAGSFIPSTGTLSPGGSTGIGMIIFYTTAGGATFNLTGKCFMNVNGKTTAGTDYDQIMTSTPLSTLDVSGATLEMVLGGAYSPATGDNIPLFVGATARTGKFSSQTLPTSWTMDYTATTAAKVKLSIIISSERMASELGLTSTSDLSIINGGFLIIDVNTSVNSITIERGGKVTNNSSATLSANTFTINSDANGTGTYVDNGTTTINTVAIKQYLTSGRNWYMSSPVIGASSAVLNLGSSVISYNEPTSGWVTENTTTLSPMKGYISVGITSTGTVTFNGSMNTGIKSISLPRTTGVLKEGFNLVGNPYPSFVNWDAAIKTNIEPTMWYRSKNIANTVYVFDTYNANSEVGTGNNGMVVTSFIPPMQAFWVRVVVGNSTGELTFDNNMRSHANAVSNKLKAPSSIAQKLVRLEVSNNINRDEAIVLFNANASDNLDDYDSPKMTNNNATVPEIYTFAGEEELVINGLNDVSIMRELPLGFRTGESNSFSIKAKEIDNFEKDIQLILRDNLLNIEQEITNGNSYSFISDAITTNNRFSLIFKTASVLTYFDDNFENTISVHQTSNKQIVVNSLNENFENGNISVYSIAGQLIENKQFINQSVMLNRTYLSGVYLLKLYTNAKTFTRKIIIN